jgi:ATP-dependent Clp protease, protease subunit
MKARAVERAARAARESSVPDKTASALDMAARRIPRDKRGMPTTDNDAAASPYARAGDALFHARTVLLFGDIDAARAAHVCAQLLALAAQGDAPITLVVSSPGGHVESGDAIHDVIRFVRPAVRVVGTGWVASAGALVYVAAPRAQRYALPNTRFMLHEPSGGFGGQAADVEIEAREIVRMRARLNALFAAATGQREETIARDTQRNHWLSADEALRYGLVGSVIASVDELR